MPLTDAKIRNLKTPETEKKISDGHGLYLLLKPAGGRLWRVAYRFGGKQKALALGQYPHVSLAEARQKRDAAKDLLAKGVDPSQQVKVDKAMAALASGNIFDVIADEFLAKVTRDGLAETTLMKKRWLLDLARPDLGRRPITAITASEILVALRKVEAQGNYETARRLRATIGQVFRYAIATARADNDPTFGLRGALTTPKVTHRVAITDWQRLAGLVRTIWEYEGALETRAALKLMALLYPRPGELRQANWEEFELDKGVWTIPATRTKMRKEHRKPLPVAAVDILRDLYKLTGTRDLAFPSISAPARPISENTLNAALRRMGFTKEEMTSHGFRATASTLLNESGKWNPDAIEAELGHVGADEVRRAYHRATYWEERVAMAAWWNSEILNLMR
ncbi:tyrosine-type recombinase/integrase [Stappia sp. F7233]|uniref:Tyrosine-type recombinase/integrase n=1 Tax=Stappia albiluteola TaxID=2758565 RepID=A0A839ABH3_9HYPH|nr:integrase arm-type DNA-binding domain-containing protein [Stappia albiluteola]MBA5777030.1 tyrosine-type recombinase/integrase [Stappia albiluteola]